MAKGALIDEAGSGGGITEALSQPAKSHDEFLELRKWYLIKPLLAKQLWGVRCRS